MCTIFFFGSDSDNVNTDKLDEWTGALHGAPISIVQDLCEVYRWMIEEIDEDPCHDEVVASEVWSFTVPDRIVVDHTEPYNDTNNLILGYVD